MPELQARKLFYNTILTQAFTPDGQYLLAGSAYGDVAVYNLSKSLGPRKGDESQLQGPTHRFVAYTDRGIQSMIATDGFLVIGTSGEISGWDWKVIISNKALKAKASWTIQLPSNKDSHEKPDVNYMSYMKADHLLYAGCGDNNIYVINLENGKISTCLKGHTDYIHCLATLGNQLASCSEDGSVRLWDVRKRENTNILSPYLVDKVSRQRLGKWIGAVDFTDDWLLCGGGPCLSLWHMRTMEPATIFDLKDEGIHVVKIYEERVIAGGASPHVHQLTYQGDSLAKIPTSSNTVYSIVYRETPKKVLSISGSSNYLDLCTNFNYRELILKFS